MKTIILSFLLLGFSLSSYAFVSGKDLLAYYDFEDNTQNQVGNYLHLTPTSDGSGNPTFVNVGKKGKSISFSGFNALHDDYGFINTLGESSQHSIAVSYWVKLASTQGTKTHFQFFESFFAQQSGNTGNIESGIIVASNGTTSASSVGAHIVNLSTGVWNHVVVMYDQEKVSNNFNIYINNYLAYTTTVPVANIHFLSDYFILGAGNVNGVIDYANKGFIGEIDEMYVFNRALTSSEVTHLYNLNSPGAKKILPHNLLAYYPFDVDYKNAHNNLVYNLSPAGSTNPLIVNTGKKGKAVQFENNNALTTNEFFNLFANATDKSFTIAYWFVNDTHNNKQYPTSLELFENLFIRSETQIGISRSSTDWPSITKTTTKNNWHHVAVSYNSSSKFVRVHVDGVLQNSIPNVNQLFQYAGNLVVGAGTNSGTVNFTAKGFKGLVDELYIFNRVLSDSEIVGLYELSPLANEYTVEFASLNDNAGTVSATVNNSPISSGDKVLEGAQVLFTANPLPGFIVSGWQLNSQSLIFRGGTPSSYSFTINANTEITVVFASDPTSIHESRAQLSNVSIVYHPSSRYVAIDAAEKIQRISIFDIAGNVLRIENGNSSENQLLDLNSLPQGVYIISVATNSGVTTKKLFLN